MKKLSLLVAILLVIISCRKETHNACDSDNPMEDVTWLKELKASLVNCTCEMSIIQGTYQGQVVFFIALTDPLCDGIDMPALYDCNGKVVKQFTEENFREFYDSVTRDKVLHRCKTTQ